MRNSDMPLQQQVEELLQFVYLMPVAIIKLGQSGDIAMLNPMAVQLLADIDIDPCALDGRQVLDALSPGLGALWTGSSDNTGQICEPVLSSFFADSARAVHLVVRVVRPDRHCTMVSVEDVTTTVQRERELYLNRQQLGLVLERIQGYCVAMLDAQGNVTEWNPSIDRMLGASVTDRVGKPLAEFLSPTDRSNAFQHFSVVAGRVAEHGLFRCEAPLQHTSGDVLWGELVVTPTVSADGAVSGYVVVIRDISEQRHTQQ
ncbi:MAG: PAS domain S-box protein, partial [Rhizobacter sp.]|nr:PAS domain S-box protein [Burkholderiales bacterium]